MRFESEPTMKLNVLFLVFHMMPLCGLSWPESRGTDMDGFMEEGAPGLSLEG